MKKKVVFLVCLLISAGLGGTVGEESIAIPSRSLPNTLSADIPTPAAELSKLVLTLGDLPTGFRELPPATFQQLVTRLDRFKPASVFAYNKSDDQQSQVILGFTMQVSNPTERAKFDAEIREGSFAKELSKGLNGDSPEDRFPDFTPLTLEDKIGETSASWTSTGKIQGQPVNVELAVFRRGTIVSCLMFMYLNGKKPAITMSAAARQLDKRIVELKPDLTQPQ